MLRLSPKNYGLQRILSAAVDTGKGDKVMNLFACGVLLFYLFGEGTACAMVLK